MILVFLGAPGAGKGTQAALISETFKIPHISTGEIFRTNIREQTELGKKAQAYIDNGLLCPDDITIALVKDRIKNADCVNGFILDGFPRTINQAEFLDKTLSIEGLSIDAAVDIEVSDESIIARMSGRRVCPECGATYHIIYNKPQKDSICDVCGTRVKQRADDDENTVRKRLVTYHEQTAPLINYYDEKGILLRVNGSVGIGQTLDAIVKDIGKLEAMCDLSEK